MREQRGFTHYALFPQILINLTWFIVEIVFFLTLLSILNKIINLKNIWAAIVLIVLFSLIESWRRKTPISQKTFALYLKVFFYTKVKLKKLLLSFKKRSAILVFYIASSLLFVIFLVFNLIKGINTPTIPITSENIGLLNNAITISTIVLVIFFGIIVAVIQFVSKDFSEVFLKIVITDSIFISGVLIILAINIGFFTLLRFGLNKYLLNSIYISACYIILIFLSLFLLTLYYLSIPNILTRTQIRIIKHIKRNVPKAPRPIEGTVFQAKITKTMKFLNWVAYWIFGSIELRKIFRLGVADRDVPEEIIESIKETLRPIGSTVLIAIEKERREVVIACLHVFESAIKTYMEERKNYIGGIDQFNMFVLSQYEAALEIILKSPNQKYTEDITDSAARIAKFTLDSKTITVWGKSNAHVGIWAKFMRDIILKTFHLMHTAAPMVAAGEIGKIANFLILKGMYDTAIYDVTKNLNYVGELLARTNSLYPSQIINNCITGFMNLIRTCLILSSKGKPLDDIYIKNITESISKVLRVAKEKNISPNNYDTIIAPLVSPFWIGTISLNIPQLTEFIFNLQFKNEEAEISTLDQLQEVFKELGWAARISLDREKMLAGYWFTQAFAGAVFYTLKYTSLNKKDAGQKQRSLQELLKEVVKSISDAMSFAFCQKNFSKKDLYHYSAMPALIIFFAQSNGISWLLDVFKISLKMLTENFEYIKPEDDPYGHIKKSIRSYIQLLGAWLYLYFPKSSLSKSTIKFLKKNKIEEEIQNMVIRSLISEMVQIGYPVGDTLYEGWYLYPSEHWQNTQAEINKALNNLKNYRKYSVLVNK